MDCLNCPLYGKANKVWGEALFPSYERLTKAVVIIGQGPGTFENYRQRPFIGPAGNFLRNVLKQTDFPQHEIFLDNIIICKTPRDREPSIKEVKCCVSHLRYLSVSLFPFKAVIFAGHFAQSQRFRYHSFLKNIPLILSAPHPAAALHAPATRRAVTQEWLAIFEQITKYLKTGGR